MNVSQILDLLILWMQLQGLFRPDVSCEKKQLCAAVNESLHIKAIIEDRFQKISLHEYLLDLQHSQFIGWSGQ